MSDTMKRKYAADQLKYSESDRLIREGKLREAWKIHPDLKKASKKRKVNDVNV
tara:strand:- start:309 stop:467 length:159 start_codon:yes stop_codon:yes gene_type:complete